MQPDYDVLIIGSGFGGSVSALRLTEKGYRVGVLEAGRRYADADFAKNSWHRRDFLWAPKLGCYGIQRIHLLRNVMILAGAEMPDLHARIAQSAPAALDAVLSRPHVAIAPPVRNLPDDDLAALCLAEELAKLEARRGARREIEDAMEDMDGLPDEGLTWRLSQAAEARHRSEKSGQSDSADLGEDRAALSRQLQRLIDDQVWVKKNR